MPGFLKRRRFRDVVRRQLSLFAEGHGDLVEEARAALASYHASPDPVEAQAHYGRYDDLAEDVEEALYDMCDRFAESLGDDVRVHYVAEFDRQARRCYGDLIPRLGFDEPR